MIRGGGEKFGNVEGGKVKVDSTGGNVGVGVEKNGKFIAGVEEGGEVKVDSTGGTVERGGNV